MKKNKKKGFTLIELIAVLVIMAILALVVTPLVMNVIRKARISADKRSVDAYGRSIELAIAGYLLDNGKFPTEISQLTIEYSGNKVECETTQINTDSSVYLAGCTVAGRSVENYTYGRDKSPTYTAYTVGDQVTYNNVDYYVIKDSGAKEPTVTLLKAEPLSYEEVQTYSNGTGVSTYDSNGYGGMQYGTTSDYSKSYIKQTVDAWKAEKAPLASEARLIQYDEIIDNFGYEWGKVNPSTEGWVPSSATPNWVYNSNYWYWAMTPIQESTSGVWYVGRDGELGGQYVTFSDNVVRPVITISKSVISNSEN